LCAVDLEEHLQSTLKESSIPILSCDLTESARCQRCRRRWIEILMIEHVERLNSKIKREAIVDREQAAHLGIDIEVLRSAEAVAPDIAIGAKLARWNLR